MSICGVVYKGNLLVSAALTYLRVWHGNDEIMLRTLHANRGYHTR
jgi:hypothetical protein